MVRKASLKYYFSVEFSFAQSSFTVSFFLKITNLSKGGDTTLSIVVAELKRNIGVTMLEVHIW